MTPRLAAIQARTVEVGDCWEWQGALQACGTTPTTRLGRKTISVRRLILIDAGVNVEGRVATCTCDNRLCVRPEHIELITRKRLTKRVGAKLRRTVSVARIARIAERARKHAKLTVELAAQIREAAGSQRAIATQFGVCQATVSMIKRGRTWRDYSNPFAHLFR